MSLARTALSSFSRRMASSGSVHPGYAKTQPIKEAMCIEDGTPVHLKGGTLDKALMLLTGVACVAGLGLDLKTFWDLANK